MWDSNGFNNEMQMPGIDRPAYHYSTEEAFPPHLINDPQEPSKLTLIVTSATCIIAAVLSNLPS